MKRLFFALLMGLIAMSLTLTTVEAKRFGGGKSFGMQRNSSTFSRSNVNSTPSRTTAAAATPASSASKWLGPLAGLGIGALLGSMLMGHGLGSGILTWLLVGGVILLAWGFIRNRLQPQTMQKMNFQTEPAQMHRQSPYAMPLNEKSFSNSTPSTEFNEDAFLRHAKTMFIRLQTDFDTKNASDIRDFTSPEVYAEIQLQLQEMGDGINQTEIINIHSELLDLSTDETHTTATVLFSGSLREELNAEPVSIKELWHFRKENTKTTWLVVGIQQAN